METIRNKNAPASQTKEAGDSAPGASREDAESLSILALIHTRVEHRLYRFMLEETRSAQTEVGFFTNKYLLRSGIGNLTSIRRACEGLVEKRSIEKRAAAGGDGKNSSFFVVYGPSAALARRSGETSDPDHGAGLPASGADSLMAAIARMGKNFALSRREADVLRLVAEGLTNAEIGRALFVQEETVKFHMRNIFRKTGTGRRGALISYVLRNA